jgi:maltooligosyltrehalose trehalohydrolase
MRNGIDITKKGIGAVVDENNTLVRIWAPKAKSLELVLPATGQKLPMSEENFGYWTCASELLTEGITYQVVMDGGPPLPDPASVFQPEGVHGPSSVTDLQAFVWTDQHWKNPELKDYILYELHTGTFSDSGDFDGIEEKLDHFVLLGVNAIELMPLGQFPGNRNWGYDGVFPFAVQNSYGGPKGLQKLVNACHMKGIAVIVDVVYNHLGPEGNYLGSYGPYFTNKYNTPWGPAINFDDAGCDAVRRYFIENALMWFRDFHVDALRMDAVHAIRDFSPVHILRDIREHVDQLMQATGKDHYLIVELDLNDKRFIDPKTEGGFGMDAQWIDEFHHALRVTAGGETTGYYSDFNGIAHLAKSYKDAYVYDGQYSPHRDKLFGVKVERHPGHQFVVFSQNHDQVGNRMLGERSSQLVSFEMQKLMAGAVLVSPFLPMLFMGEEWSEPNPFLYFVSHTDPDLAEAVRKGRKEEFAAFHAQGEAPDPMSEKTFHQSKLQWKILQKDPHSIMFSFYQEMIRLRKHHPALKDTDRSNVSVECNEQEQTLLLRRRHEATELVCLMNFSKTSRTVQAPAEKEQWKLHMDSSSRQWGGPTEKDQLNQLPVTIHPESFIIYSNHHA